MPVSNETTISGQITITCSVSGISREVGVTANGNPKLPRGWKWRGERAVSAEAWHSLYSLRAITVPVVSPIADDMSPAGLKAAWKALDQQLVDAWKKSSA